MKNRTAEDILSFTFKHLETVLKGKSEDQDGFAGKTAVRADALYTLPKRKRASRASSGIDAGKGAREEPSPAGREG